MTLTFCQTATYLEPVNETFQFLGIHLDIIILIIAKIMSKNKDNNWEIITIGYN